jgi:uncharacterized membrane protein HdeD (DUF308 family)
MKNTLHRVWIEILIAGLSAFLFGVAILVFSTMPLFILLWVFAIYMFIKGLSLSIGAARTKRKESYWHFLLAYGIVNIVTGIVSANYPNVTILILGFIVSINLLFSGILQLIMAFHLRKEIPREGWLIVSGSITLSAGAYIYIMPRVSSTTILFLVAVGSLVLSVYLVTLSIAARNWNTNIEEIREPA